MDRGILIYIHPTCATSYNLIKHLYEKNLLDKVNIYNTSNISSIGDSYKIWSVPWILYKGEPLATDPIDPDEVELLVVKGESKSILDPIDSFMNTVLHSAFASALVIVHSSLNPVIDQDLVSASIRGPFNRDLIEPLISELKSKSEKLYRDWRDKITRALAISFVRELWWSRKGDLSQEDLADSSNPYYIGTWLLAKASIGRVGLPDRPDRYDFEAVEAISRFLSTSAKGLIRRIEREQRNIFDDEQYWNILYNYLKLS